MHSFLTKFIIWINTSKVISKKSPGTFPVKYLSLHNEGEDWKRWPKDGSDGNIYSSKVNGLIPWAGIQRPEQWVGGDPNPGCAIQVYEDGSYEVMRGYYFYKQVTRAGQPDMAVSRTSSMDAMTAIIAFASNGTENPNAFVVINTSVETRPLNIDIKGTDGKTFKAYRTNKENERHEDIGIFKADEKQQLFYEAPKGSVTTFYEK